MFSTLISTFYGSDNKGMKKIFKKKCNFTSNKNIYSLKDELQGGNSAFYYEMPAPKW
jgi:hypothetical protein